MGTKATKSMDLSDSQIQYALQDLVKQLERDDADKAVRLFLQDQTRNLFPKSGDVLEWLTKNAGKNTTKKLISACTHFSCLNCKKGMMRCKNCDGTGHFGYEMVCEPCLGFGSLSCDFCGGTGWAAIDFVPEGLRPVVFASRIKIAERRLTKLLKKQPPRPSQKEATRVFNECKHLLLNLNRQISVLETAVGITKEIANIPDKLEEQTYKLRTLSINAGLKGKRRLGKIVQSMTTGLKFYADNQRKDSKMYQLAKARASFYNSLLKSAPEFTGTYLEHPFLNEAAEKTIFKKAPKRKRR